VIRTRPFLQCFVAVLCIATVAQAQSRRRNPTSKLYVADTVGDSQIDIGTEIKELTKASVFNAEGTVIDTKVNSNASVVLSNGTGLYFDVDTRVQIKEFLQEAFRPNRSDIEDEPSLSSTRIFVDHGVIGISMSKLVAGSTMVCETSLSSASFRGRQAVVVADDDRTVISMVQGEATVQAGPLDRSHLVKNRQQIIITRGKAGEPNTVEIRDIIDGATEDREQWLEERVFTADAARKLVYFQTQAVGASVLGSNSGSDGGIALFDGSGGTSGNEIVAVPIVPSTPTVPNVSVANLTSR
jgi:hypothetical protein